MPMVRVDRVTITGPVSIVVGAQVQFTAIVTDPQGDAMTGVPVTWNTDLPTVATVDQSGTVHGLNGGSATVTATAAGVTGSAAFHVVPPIGACKPDAHLDAWCRLTDSPYDQTFPSISGNRVVWADRRPGDGNQVIVMLDLTTGQTTSLTPENEESLLPTIDGDRVVYARLPVSGDWQLLTYDLRTGIESQFSTISRDLGLGRFSLSGDRVAWHTRRNDNWDVYVYDFSTQTEARITTDPAEQADPSISGNRVAWIDRRNTQTWWDLYLYDFTTKRETRITQGPTAGRSPALSGDRILWGDLRDGATFELYEYAFNRPDHERKLSVGLVENWIVTAGPYAAWMTPPAPGGFLGQIAAYDFTSGRRVLVTTLLKERLPAISQDYLVWEDYRNGDGDIYIARIGDIFKP
jgi:TolB protein